MKVIFPPGINPEKRTFPWTLNTVSSGMEKKKAFKHLTISENKIYFTLKPECLSHSGGRGKDQGGG